MQRIAPRLAPLRSLIEPARVPISTWEPDMSFTTAIFYDIENLTRGYNFSQQVLENLSLKDIVDSIRQTEKISSIAIQRAYANWSDSRLAIMRGEINELGIDPIQVFGFHRELKKNAADIQLAIDAIDLAHVRPALTTFVIVSGDGGFASLAKKLHEYGKTVIGCAYRNAANKTFRAVCDSFVWLEGPEEEERKDRTIVAMGSPSTGSSGTIPSPAVPGIFDPRNKNLAATVKKCKTGEPDEVLAKAREILGWYATNSGCLADLRGSGIYLNVIQEAMKYAVANFQSMRYGFAKFSEYLQYVCKGTEFCVARPQNSQAVLMLRDAVQTGVEILPDLDLQDLQTVEGYRSLLATGGPIFRLPQASELHNVCHGLLQHPPEKVDLGTTIEELVASVPGLSSDSAKLGMLSLLSSGAFLREPEGVPLSEQQLTLKPEFRSVDAMMTALQIACKQKLTQLLPTVHEEFIQQLLGIYTPSPPSTESV